MEIVKNLLGSITKLNLTEELKRETLKMIHRTYVGFNVIYTYGSVNFNEGKVGAGFYNQENSEKYYTPASSRSNMDAELLALNAALTSCIKFIHQ